MLVVVTVAVDLVMIVGLAQLALSPSFSEE
jgi:hypothetical protein